MYKTPPWQVSYQCKKLYDIKQSIKTKNHMVILIFVSVGSINTSLSRKTSMMGERLGEFILFYQTNLFYFPNLLPSYKTKF